MLGYAGNLAILALNARLSAAAVSGAAIGFSTSVQAVGIVAGALAAASLRERWGTAVSIASGLCLAAVSLAMLASCDTIVSVSLFRFFLAAGTGVALSHSEYVLVMRAASSRCAVLIAAYATFFALGTLLASAVSAHMGSLGDLPFFAGAACLLLSAGVSGAAGFRARPEAASPDVRSVRLSTLSAAALVPALAYGVFEGGLISLFNIYAFHLGYGIAASTMFVSVAIAGSLILRIPFGMVAARAGARLTLSMSWAALLLLLAGMHMFSASFAALLVLAWLLGGVCDHFYIVGLASLAASISGRQLGTGTGLFVAAAGVGEIIGPALGGIGLSFGGATGFLLAFWLFACAGFVASLREFNKRLLAAAATMPSIQISTMNISSRVT